MRIRGIDAWKPDELHRELNRGGRFVVFEFCISLVVVTLHRQTDVYFLAANDLGLIRGLPWTLVTLLLGWWGVPWGLIQTPCALLTNLAGGRDVTAQACAHLARVADAATV
jgi:hypothetical protein